MNENNILRIVAYMAVERSKKYVNRTDLKSARKEMIFNHNLKNIIYSIRFFKT